MNEQEITQALKQNKMAFGLMETASFTNKEMQDKANKIGLRDNFDDYNSGGKWYPVKMTDVFITGFIYRLRQDYAAEPDVVKCEVFQEDLKLRFTYRAFHHSMLSSALAIPDFIGFLYEDGCVSGAARRYGCHISAAPISKYNSDEGEIGDEVLTPTHVLFRKTR